MLTKHRAPIFKRSNLDHFEFTPTVKNVYNVQGKKIYSSRSLITKVTSGFFTVIIAGFISYANIDTPLNLHASELQAMNIAVDVPEEQSVTKFTTVNEVLYHIIKDETRANLIYKYAQENNLPPLLVAAIIMTESNNNPKATSHVKARGLMQLMHPTAVEIAKNLKRPHLAKAIASNPSLVYDEELNIAFGCIFYSFLVDKFDSYIAALHSYNMGPVNYQRGRKNFKYTNKILKDWKQFEDMLVKD